MWKITGDFCLVNNNITFLEASAINISLFTENSTLLTPVRCKKNVPLISISINRANLSCLPRLKFKDTINFVMEKFCWYISILHSRLTTITLPNKRSWKYARKFVWDEKCFSDLRQQSSFLYIKFFLHKNWVTV